jgi:CHASE3 domain sensor protein
MHDVRELIGEVAARNNIRLDEDDPIFAVGTINRLMIEEAVEQMSARFKAIVQEFEKSACEVDCRAGKFFADEVRKSAAAWRDQINDDIKAAGLQSERLVKAVAYSLSGKQMIVCAVIGVVFGTVLMLSGVALGRYWR